MTEIYQAATSSQLSRCFSTALGKSVTCALSDMIMVLFTSKLRINRILLAKVSSRSFPPCSLYLQEMREIHGLNM